LSDEDTRANGKKGDKPTGSKRFRTRYWNPAEILLLFRDGHATDLSTLIEALRDYLPSAIPPEERSAAEQADPDHNAVRASDAASSG
jgi:hypothetical protein